MSLYSYRCPAILVQVCNVNFRMWGIQANRTLNVGSFVVSIVFVVVVVVVFVVVVAVVVVVVFVVTVEIVCTAVEFCFVMICFVSRWTCCFLWFRNLVLFPSF